MENNNNVCRFCLKVVHASNLEFINEVTQKILSVLLIKLDLDVSEDPTICKMCSGILDEIYMFKSKCLYSEDIVRAHVESNLKVSLRYILIELQNELGVHVAENAVICRLCIKIPPSGNYITLNKSTDDVSDSRNMIQLHLPEIDLNITEEPVICEVCHALLKKYLSFATSCMEVEQKIKMYCEQQRSGVSEQVALLHVLDFTENKPRDCENSFNGDLIVKREDSPVHVKVEKVEAFEKDDLSKDHFIDGSGTEFYIKEEKIEIKSEDEQISCDQGTFTTSGEECQLSGKREHHMISQKVSRMKVRNFNSLRNHKKTHDPTKHKFKCQQCEYFTYYRARLREHLMTHMKPGETVGHYCATCDFKTKYKRSLKYHLKRCSKEKEGTDSRVILQCNQCTFQTKWRNSLNNHKKTHDPTTRKFKCEQCEYSTYHRSWLKMHLVTHMELGETRMFYCETCNFKSKYKRSLYNHVKRCPRKTGDTDSRVMLQCDRCTFQTKWRSSLNNHKKTHDPTKRAFKCVQCEYSTFCQPWLNQHLVTHMELGETTVYYCGTCDFKSKHKRSLTDHLKRCSKEKEGMNSKVVSQ